jgi:uncharacterized protein (TIGR03083 family)
MRSAPGHGRQGAANYIDGVPTYLNKTATVELLADEFTALRSLCASLDAAQWDTPTSLPGWSVRDVLSHVIGSEEGLLGEPVPDVEIAHLTHMQNPIAESNERWVEAKRSLDGPAMLAGFDAAVGRRMTILGAMTQEEFDAPSWTPAGKDETYGRFMRIRHYDTYLHELDIRIALGLPPRETAADLSSSLDEVATGLGYIVGRRAGMPTGSRVRIDVTGLAPRTYFIQVDERAAVVEALDGEPTVTVVIPAVRWLRLTGGRADSGVGPTDGVELGGDDQLARHLVENLAFTI